MILLIIVIIMVGGTAAGIMNALGRRELTCPGCGSHMPRIRKPKNMRQAMWGGSTCAHCGTEMDKVGTAIKNATVYEPKLLDTTGKSPLERVFEENR